LDDFGKSRGAFNKVPAELGRNIVAQAPGTQDDMLQLPLMRDIRAEVRSDIRVDTPAEPVRRTPVTVGAASRANDDGPLDKTLRGKFIYGDRPSVLPNANVEPGDARPPSETKTARPTGAVARPSSQSADPANKEPVRTILPMPSNDSPPVQNVPRNDPPQKVITREPVKRDPPSAQPPRRPDPPPQRSEPKKEPPRRDDPPRKSDPPPQKNEPPKPEPGKQPDAPARKPREIR
jgi:hypothetical protein